MAATRLSVYCTACLIVGLCLAGCQHTSPAERGDCTRLSSLCVMRLADDALADTEDSFVWVSGAAEMAVAYDSIGETQRTQELIDRAIARTPEIADSRKRSIAYGDILSAIIEVRANPSTFEWLDLISQFSLSVGKANRAEIAANITVALAVHDNPITALEQTVSLPHGAATEANAKAKALRKMAVILAEQGQLEASLESIEKITMSISYYQAMARLDVARLVSNVDRGSLTDQLISEAETIARNQGNAYFVAAALRDIGYTYQQIGKKALANAYYDEALVVARDADKQNEKARATSRIATRMADGGVTKECEAIISDAVALANQVDDDVYHAFSFYEIAGSAAFCGELEIAMQLATKVSDISLGSTESLRQASERDIAWGLVRYGHVREGVDRASAIRSPREKMQAYSRIARFLSTPEMQALPRYP